VRGEVVAADRRGRRHAERAVAAPLPGSRQRERAGLGEAARDQRGIDDAIVQLAGQFTIKAARLRAGSSAGQTGTHVLVGDQRSAELLAVRAR